MKEYSPIAAAERLGTFLPPQTGSCASRSITSAPDSRTFPPGESTPSPKRQETLEYPQAHTDFVCATPPSRSARLYAQMGVEYVPTPPAVRSLHKALNSAGFALAASPLLQLACSFLVSYLAVFLYRLVGFGRGFRPNDWQMLVTAVAYPVSFLVPLLLLRLASGLPFRRLLSLERPRPLYLTSFSLMTFGTTLLGSFLTMLLAQFTALFGATSTSSLVQPSSNHPLDLLLYFFLLAVLPAFLEEFLFRGAILNLLRPYGDGFAILATAAFFALLHCNLEQAPPAFLTGLLFGYAAVVSGSIWVSVLAHFLNNACALALELICGALPVYTANLVSLCANAVYLLAGLVGCFLLFRKSRPELRLQPGSSRLSAGRLLATALSRPGTILFYVVCLLLTISSFHVG